MRIAVVHDRRHVKIGDEDVAVCTLWFVFAYRLGRVWPVLFVRKSKSVTEFVGSDCSDTELALILASRAPCGEFKVERHPIYDAIDRRAQALRVWTVAVDDYSNSTLIWLADIPSDEPNKPMTTPGGFDRILNPLLFSEELVSVEGFPANRNVGYMPNGSAKSVKSAISLGFCVRVC